MKCLYLFLFFITLINKAFAISCTPQDNSKCFHTTSVASYYACMEGRSLELSNSCNIYIGILHDNLALINKCCKSTDSEYAINACIVKNQRSFYGHGVCLS